ncbi:MAG: hypothetical protein CM1200mP30_17650 [Pseudomonadota bacterium]|nr:MAG: hypothetical protein CM1200mP30_17650 [Pseudomonadota bacterium]
MPSFCGPLTAEKNLTDSPTQPNNFKSVWEIRFAAKTGWCTAPSAHAVEREYR